MNRARSSFGLSMSDVSCPELRWVRTDVETSLHELLEGLDIVGLGANGADDRGLCVSHGSNVSSSTFETAPFAGIFAAG